MTAKRAKGRAKAVRATAGRRVKTGFRAVTFKGHTIHVPEDATRTKLFIDGRPARYGVVRGRYFLDVYAYDPAASLDEVLKRYVTFADRAAKRRAKET